MRPDIPDPAPGTRERLLDAAERLFAERGFAGSSVRQITDAAEANLGAVNYYFRSKEILYSEVFARRVATLRDPVIAAARQTESLARRSPAEALRALGRALLAPHEDRAFSLRLLGLFARESIEESLPPGLLVRELLVPTIDAVADVVRKVRPGLPEAAAQACARSFFAQILHIVKGATAYPTPVEEQLDHVVRFTVAAVRHMEGAPPRPSRRTAQPRRTTQRRTS